MSDQYTNSPSNSRLRDKVVVILGGLFFALVIALSWIPRDCPVLKKALIGCSTTPGLEGPRVGLLDKPYQSLYDGLSYFEVVSEEPRTRTRINFYYQAPLEETQATLLIKSGENYQPIALITNPFLTSSDWQKNIDRNRNETILSKLEATPTRDQLLDGSVVFVTDQGLADRLNIANPTLLENSTSEPKENIQTIFTSYTPPLEENDWWYFEQTLDLSSYTPNSDNILQFAIRVEGLPPTGTSNFKLSDVHVDYRK